MSNSQKVKFNMSSCLSSPVDLRDEENCIVRSHGFWNSSILPILLLVARLFPCYTQDSLPLRCQSVSERSFGGLEPPCVQRNGPLGSDSGVTSSFGNVFDSSFNNRTGFLANDPLSSVVDWKLEENGSQPVRRISHDSVNIFINRLNKHRAIFLAWNAFLEVQPPKIPLSGYGTEIRRVLSLSYVCPQAGSVSSRVYGAFTGAERAKRHASRIISE